MLALNSTVVYDTGDWNSGNIIYFICVIVLQLGLKVPARVFGITANLLALLVFQRSGLRDGISVCFMVLTLSDEMCLVANLLASVLGYLDLEARVKTYISLYYVAYIFPFYGLMFYNISTMITVFLAIQKCCCIALPWNFKSYFSKPRCVAAVCGVYLVCGILYIPFTATALPFVEAFDVETNSTYLTFAWSAKYLNDVFPVLKAVNYISIPFIAEILVLISTIILSIKLKEASKFRSATLGINGSIFYSPPLKNPRRASSFLKDSNYNSLEVNQTKESHFGIQTVCRKELRATLAVNIVAVVFVATNTPDVVVYLGSLLQTEFSAFGVYQNIFRVCVELQDFLHVLNLSLNLFIYVRFNTRFANALKSFLLRQ